MSKPWERQWGKAPSAAPTPGAKPWERQWGTSSSGATTSQPVQSQVIKTVQEMHPDVSTADRLLIKNLAQTPEKGLEYLKKKLPGHDIQLRNGEIKLRRPDEKEFRVVDPDTGIISKDILHDIGDIGWDIGSGIAEAGAVAGGAVGGAVLGGGVGAVPGAIAAGGTAGALAEGGRQKLGQMLGLNQEVDGTDVAISGAIGAASPALMGYSAPFKNAAKVAAKASRGRITQEAAEAAMNKSGALGKGLDYTRSTILPKVGEMASGIKAETLKAYAKHMDKVDELERTGVDEYTAGIFDKLKGYVDNKKRAATDNLLGVLKGADKKVNVSGAKAAFLSEIRDIENLAEPTGADLDRLNALKTAYNKHFGLAEPIEFPLDPREVARHSADVAQYEEQAAKQAAQVAEYQARAGADATQPALAGMVDNGDQTVMEKLRVMVNGKEKNMVAETGVIDPQQMDLIPLPKKKVSIKGGMRYQVKDNMPLYKKRLIEQIPNPGEGTRQMNIFDFEPDQRTFANAELPGIESGKAGQQVEMLLEPTTAPKRPAPLVQRPAQTHVSDEIDAMRAMQIKNDLSQLAKWGTDVTPADASMKTTSRNSAMRLNDGFDEAAEFAPEARAQYGDAIRAEDELLPKFEGPNRMESIQKTFNTLTSLDGKSRKILSERLNKLAADGSLDLTDESEILTAYKFLANPEKMPISSGGTTSTSRTNNLRMVGGSLGTLAGYQMGEGYSGAAVGGIGGAAAGGMLASPAALKNYMKLQAKMSRANAKLAEKVGEKRGGTTMKAILRNQMGQGIASPVVSTGASMLGAKTSKEKEREAKRRK